MRTVRFLLALVVAVVAGVFGASAVIGSPSAPLAASPAALEPDGSGATIVATAPDPDAPQGSDAPTWAVRVYRSQAGLTCPEAGRSRDGDFGRVDGDGTFRPLALAPAGQCFDMTEAPYSLDVDHYPADDQRGARAVIYGAVDPSAVKRVTLVAGDGARTALAVDGGAYVAPLADADAATTQVEVALADGTTQITSLRPSTLGADGARP